MIKPGNHRFRSPGLSLIELIAVLAVSAVLISAAAPSMKQTVDSARLNGHADALLSALATSRTEAIRRGQSVVVCPSRDAVSCSTASEDWSTGWIIFPDPLALGNPSSPAAIIRTYQSNDTRIRATAAATLNGGIRYTAQGYSERPSGAFQAGTIAFCLPAMHAPENGRQIVIARGGRVRSSRVSVTDCS